MVSRCHTEAGPGGIFATRCFETLHIGHIFGFFADAALALQDSKDAIEDEGTEAKATGSNAIAVAPKPRAADAAPSAPAKAALLGTAVTKPQAKEKLSVKDRTKHQRLAGQTGLDHRTWRSEEEMRLRQQFDG